MSESTIPAEDRPSNPEVQTEARDVSPRGVFLFGLGLTLVLIASNLLVGRLFNHFEDRQEAEKRSPFPLASTMVNRLPPEPRLDGIERMQRREGPGGLESDLTSYRWIDEKAGVAQIPLAEALKLIAEQNLLPARPKPVPERKQP